ncbi:uncharacterized protein SCDLUD_004199 [Saccharomycodes ludwigii]|uniref:uncharacterized protein n=1 Tax=Saccharomycodes ludwigii TaxID=36035 RepID=UPI001E8B68A0|nr:hypothetical protein SCDLUD_004199 [Saccharomycodes ludwigii]KAH3899896.1 hypothetical protein SCDLUD_004199 [Saccharomycodes ludwigii]
MNSSYANNPNNISPTPRRYNRRNYPNTTNLDMNNNGTTNFFSNPGYGDFIPRDTVPPPPLNKPAFNNNENVFGTTANPSNNITTADVGINNPIIPEEYKRNSELISRLLKQNQEVINKLNDKQDEIDKLNLLVGSLRGKLIKYTELNKKLTRKLNEQQKTFDSTLIDRNIVNGEEKREESPLQRDFIQINKNKNTKSNSDSNNFGLSKETPVKKQQKNTVFLENDSKINELNDKLDMLMNFVKEKQGNASSINPNTPIALNNNHKSSKHDSNNNVLGDTETRQEQDFNKKQYTVTDEDILVQESKELKDLEMKIEEMKRKLLIKKQNELRKVSLNQELLDLMDKLDPSPPQQLPIPAPPPAPTTSNKHYNSSYINHQHPYHYHRYYHTPNNDAYENVPHSNNEKNNDFCEHCYKASMAMKNDRPLTSSPLLNHPDPKSSSIGNNGSRKNNKSNNLRNISSARSTNHNHNTANNISDFIITPDSSSTSLDRDFYRRVHNNGTKRRNRNNRSKEHDDLSNEDNYSDEDQDDLSQPNPQDINDSVLQRKKELW